MTTSCIAKKLGVITSALAVLVLVLVLAPGQAEARRRYGGGMGEPGASTFGIGLILGTPTGLSLELRLSPRSALDFAIGFGSFDDDDDYYDDDDGYLHFDYLVYLADLARGGSVAVPFYLGIGAAFWDNDRRNDFDNDDLNMGIRVPFGLALAFRSAPVQFFFELALRLQILDENDSDDDLDLTGALGFRVYF